MKGVTTALFNYSGVVSRDYNSIKIDFPPTLMVYHRKISTGLAKNKML